MRRCPWVLAVVVATACRREPEAKRAPEGTSAAPETGTLALPEGFVEPRGRGDDAIPSPARSLWIGPKAVRLEPRGKSIVDVPEDAVGGFPAETKDHGAVGLLVKPIASELGRVTGGKLVLHFDARTTYRVLLEVAFTAGQQGFDDLSFAVRKADGGEGAVRIVLVRPEKLEKLKPLSAELDAASPTQECQVNPAVIVGSDGYFVKANGARIAPGCDGLGKGTTLPRRAGKLEPQALTACLAKIRDASKCSEPERSISFTANPDVDMQSLVDTMDAVRRDGTGKALYPDLVLTVMH
ncbi:MAG: hypothetical protein IPJ34_19630 [Myxococcales bacterium]|nr:hypothetical protein [Myxococcales bacterium]